MCPADGAEHLDLVGEELVPAGRVSDLPVRAEPTRVGLGDESCRDLVLGHCRDFGGIGVAQVIPPARHDVKAGHRGDLPEMVVVHAHVRMPRVDDADHAVVHRLLDVGDHGSGVGRRRGRKPELACVARVDAVEVLMEERRAVRKRVRVQVGEDRANHRALLEGDRPRPGRGASRRREKISCSPSRHEETEPSRSHQPEGLATVQLGRGLVLHRRSSSRKASGGWDHALKLAGPARRRDFTAASALRAPHFPRHRRPSPRSSCRDRREASERVIPDRLGHCFETPPLPGGRIEGGRTQPR